MRTYRFKNKQIAICLKGGGEASKLGGEKKQEAWKVCEIKRVSLQI